MARYTKQKECDRLFSLFIRHRDKRCRRCRKVSDIKKLQCHHLIGRVYRKIRFDPRNGVALCYGCHKFLTHRPLENEEFILATIGGETYEELRSIARNTTQKADLDQIHEWLKEEARKGGWK